MSGVDEIIYGGYDSYFERAIEKYKDNPIDMGIPDGWSVDMLKYTLFGNSTEIKHFNDCEDRPTYYGNSDEDNWYKEYSAD